MKYVLSTDSLTGYGLNRIFEFAKEAGFNGIDLQLDKKNIDTNNADYLNTLIKETQIEITSIQLPAYTTKKEILKAIKLAKEVRSNIIIVQAPKVFNVKLTNWFKKDVPKLRKSENISIALENAPATTILGFIPEHSLNNLAELKRFKHACLNTSRTAERKEDLIITLKKLMKYLVHIHISNISKGHGGHMPQNGILPLESFLTKLKEDKYKGALSLKVKPKYLEVGNDEKVLKNLKESLEYLKKYSEN